MKLLTIQDIGDTLKVSEKTVRRLITSGHLIAYKVGDRGQLRIKQSDLEEYIEAHRVQATDTEKVNKDSKQ